MTREITRVNQKIEMFDSDTQVRRCQPQGECALHPSVWHPSTKDEGSSVLKLLQNCTSMSITV